MRTKSFTLIEVLVAMGIFMVGIAPILGVVSASTRKYQENISKANIGDLAQDKLAEFRYASDISEFDKSYTTSKYPGIKYRIDNVQIAPNVYKVTLGIGPKDASTSTASDNVLTQFNYIYYAE